MKILKYIIMILIIISLIAFLVILLLPKRNYVGVQGYRYYPSPSPCWIEDQLEQIGCPYEEEASPSPSASPSVTPNTGPEGNVPPPALVDYNQCTYRDCNVTPGISAWDGSKVGEK